MLDHADEVGKVVVFNSHARSRSEVVTVKVSAANVRVYKVNLIDGDEEEESVECQGRGLNTFSASLPVAKHASQELSPHVLLSQCQLVAES